MEYHKKLYRSQYDDEPDIEGTHNKYGIHITWLPNFMPGSNRSTLEYRTSIMEEKIAKNMENILKKVQKLKNNQSKKYQISGYHEYKKLKCMLDGMYRYELVHDKKLCRNVVTEIIGTHSSNCCSECDGNMIYEHTKVPVMYVKIYGSNKSQQ